MRAINRRNAPCYVPPVMDHAPGRVQNEWPVQDEEFLTIDGSLGEGGGQVLRSALALSMWLSRPFRITNIRANRRQPGLRPQHLAAVRAAADIAGGEVRGATPGSLELVFRPAASRPGDYYFDIGTAGSATLVLQTVLPALIVAPAPSMLRIAGGTHNPMAPSFDYLQQVFLSVLDRMGPAVTARLLRPGYYPAGGGEIEVHVQPVPRLRPVWLQERGDIIARSAIARVAHLPVSIAQRELKVVRDLLEWGEDEQEVVRDDAAAGAGNVLSLMVRCRHVTEMFTAFGERGVRAEAVARQAVNECIQYLRAGVPVGPNLADQLLLPMAMAGSGVFRTGRPTSHATTNMAVIEAFTGVRFDCSETSPGCWHLAVASR